MRTVGIVLVILGILGFIVDNVSFTTDEQVADIGPVEVERQKTRTLPITPVASGGAIVVGLGLVWAGRRRQAGD